MWNNLLISFLFVKICGVHILIIKRNFNEQKHKKINLCKLNIPNFQLLMYKT